MKTTPIRMACILAAVLFAFVARVPAGEPSKEDAALASKLLGAIQNSDYDAFVADGTDAFHGITREQFASVCSSLAAKLRTARTAFLGELNQHGYRVTLWKISFAGGGDDALATLSVRDGKVGGFWIK